MSYAKESVCFVWKMQKKYNSSKFTPLPASLSWLFVEILTSWLKMQL